MKPATLNKRIKEVLDNMCDFVEYVSLLNNEDASNKIIQASEHLLEAYKLFKKAEKMCPVTNNKGKHLNRLSAKVFKKYNYTCQVCGVTDISCDTLSRAGCGVGVSQDPNHYVVLCKEHMKIYKNRLPWRERDESMKKSNAVLMQMRDEFLPK